MRTLLIALTNNGANLLGKKVVNPQNCFPYYFAKTTTFHSWDLAVVALRGLGSKVLYSYKLSHLAGKLTPEI